MNKAIKLNIWGRLFELEVIYDCYQGEHVTPLQKETALLLENDSQFINTCLNDIKNYCIENYSEEISESKIENIFKYVVPKNIFIKRNDKNKMFALMCHFKFDMEHGLAIVFKDKKLLKIGPEDIIL